MRPNAEEKKRRKRTLLSNELRIRRSIILVYIRWIPITLSSVLVLFSPLFKVSANIFLYTI